MKILFKRVLFLIIILIIVDFVFGFALNKILVNSPDGRYFKAEYSLKKCNEDIVIFGSSRAETNYAPKIFENVLNLTCWNTGRGGQSLPFWYAMEQGILSRYTPKIAIVNVEREFLSTDLKVSYERSGFLRPFYYDTPEIRPVINKISKFEKLLLMSKTYAYNSSYYYLLRPYLIKGIDGEIEDKGWKTKKGTIPVGKDSLIKINTSSEINHGTLKLFNSFISDLTSRGSKVFVVLSPNYGSMVESTSTINYLKKMKNIRVIDVSNDKTFFNNNEYFKDANHLNIDGAIEFSIKVSHEIMRYQNSI